MMFNINVKVYGGKRTELKVIAEPTCVNPRTMKLKNGTKITDAMVAQCLEDFLRERIARIAEAE